MGRASDSRTRASLLGRLQRDQTDQKAWEEFVERYAPKVHAWCRQWTASTADVEDVSQEVMLRLLKYLRDWKYNPAESFRGWLRKVTRHAWQDFCRARARAVAGSGDSAVRDQLETAEAREELVKKLDEAFDLELLEEATCRVRLRVKPATWEAFRLKHQEGLSGAEVAQRLNMKVATVFVACSKVQKMLREELLELEHPGQDAKAPS